MASKKQKSMVYHQEGAMAPAAAPGPDHPLACFVPKPAKTTAKQNCNAVNHEAGIMDKYKMEPSKMATITPDGLPAVKYPSSKSPSDNLPSDGFCKGIRVTLDNNNMWNEFFRCKTEMIVTKQGSRMFPYCRFRISGLNLSRNYSLVMDIQPLDGSHYRWTGKSWQVAGKAEKHITSQPFAHPESPSTGQHWMQNPVSFYKLKLTNNILDQDGNTILQPMHRYVPRLHVVQTDTAPKDINLNSPRVVTFTFPQTEFMAVLAYQNPQFAQLKVDYNPFAKGLKEDSSSTFGLKSKLKFGKDVHLDGGSISMEQSPVKKSLKSLLANHKPRNSKAADIKASGFGDSPTNKDQSAVKAPKGNVCGISHPAQKLFSELIREAHVSLQRCNMEQLSISNGTCHRTDQTNTKTVILKSHREDDMSVQTQNRLEEGQHHFNSSDCDGGIETDCLDASNVTAPALTQNSPVDTGWKCKPEIPSEVVLKQHKRPVPLPLPALALFLKQHSTKTKKLKSKQDCPTSSLSPGLQMTSAAFARLPVDSTSSGRKPMGTVDVTESKSQATGGTGSGATPKEVALNDTGQVVKTAFKPLSLSCVNAVVTSDGIRSESPVLAEGTTDRPPGSPLMSVPTVSSPCTFSPALDTMLPVLQSPQTEAITESSMLPPVESKMKSESVLSDPDCSSVGFEPLSPASSPEPLPPWSASLGLELDSRACGSSVDLPDGLQHSRNSAMSVFKWHTVLPPPEPYTDASFTTFEPTPQPLPLTEMAPPFLDSQPPLHLEPQPLHTSSPPTAPTFQENEQSLPFPAELSPLALQLPLSPTFSSLDGDGLSPTPSLADLVHFFSTDDDLGMEVEFSNTEAVAPSCSPPSIIETTAHDFSQQVQPIPASKTFKRKKPSLRQKLNKTIEEVDQKSDTSTYTKMQPNLEEVEEQLFISFTSKEALRVHVADSAEPAPRTPEDTPENAETLETGTSALERSLLRDLKLMKHRQVIHPVLQEVGLKMNLLDPTLAIDLRYLGVRLPLPPPGVPVELPPPQAFVSRTGKTTDVTQIKGWREKFTPPEASPAALSAKPEAGPSSDLPKKNLSAFCSDMLDEYLEHEGKLIDERIASFAQPQVEPVVYELPTRSTSYVRTLGSVLKKRSSNTPTSDLISGFIPPSKRPKCPPKERKMSRSGEQKIKGAKQNKLKLNSEPGPTPKQTLPSVLTLGVHPGPRKSKKKHQMVQFNHTESVSLSPQETAFKKIWRLKAKPSCETLSPLTTTVGPPAVSEDMAPLESDSEVVATDQASEPCKKHSRAMITQALLRQRNLEDRVMWEGSVRTSITEERATIALMSLFTQMGFVSENPTVPIQPLRGQTPPCLNAFCRLGCICSSLSYHSSTSHCGRPQCMFGCSCLKQKVVLLKNLDSFDCSSSQHQNNKKRRRRRMKMAYILKEADSVSQPAKRIQILWKKDCGGSDLDPVHVPDQSSRPHFNENRESSSCARARGFTSQKKTAQQWKEATKFGKSKVVRLKSLMNRDLTLKEPKTKPATDPPAHKAVQAALCKRTSSPPPEQSPKPSKRLIILAECKWESDSDRNQVLKALCESMAQDRLRDSFWIKKYLISPLTKTVEENGTDCCIQYKIHISTPKVEPEKGPVPSEPQQGTTKTQQTQEVKEHLQQVATEGPLEVWQQEVMEDEELLEDWQREVEEDDIVGDEVSGLPQVDNAEQTSKEKRRTKARKMNSMGLPFLTGISPAGFLSASRKMPGGTDHLVQVNGKLYPLAKIQLGKMGALHPANRLAAYLTGRVGSNKDKVSSPIPPQTAGPTPPSTPRQPGPQTSLLPFMSSTELKGKPSAGGTVTRLHMANIPPRPLGDPGQVKHGPAPKDSRVNTSVVRPVNPFMGSASSKASRVLMVEVLGSLGKVPVSGPSTPPTSQRMVLKPVHTASGVQFYRRPDGKLVQLVPVSQLKSGNPNPLLQKGPPSVLPAAFLPTPSVTVVKQTQPLPSINSTISSAASLSGPRSSSGPLSSSLPPLSSGPLPQIGMCTFKILPAGSNKEPIIFTCPKAPMQHLTKVVPVLDSAPVTPVRLVSLQPSPGGGAGIGAKPVSVSPAPVGSGGLLASLELATSESPTEKALLEAATSPPPSDRNSPEPEVACGLVDLDIICVDDETMEVVNVGGLSSSETENSSDFESDVEGDKEMMTTNLTHPAKPVRRLLHNVLERKRRGQIKQLFESLKKELGLNQEKTSKVSILKKAVQVIEELRAIHRQLDRKRRRLMDRRQKYLCTIGLTKEEKKQDLHRGRCLQEKQKTNKKQAVVEVVDLLDETDENTDNTSDEELVVTKTSDIITITSDKEDEVQCVAMGKGFGRLSSDSCLMKTLEAPTDTKASRAPSSVLDTSNLTLLREKACKEIHPLQHQHRHSDLTKVCPGSGESEPMVPEKQQQQQDHNSALDEVQPSAADSKPPPIAKDTVDVITRASDQPQPPQRPPTPVSILTPVQQPHVVLQLTGPAPRLRDKTRTMPNILSRRKNRGEALSFHSLVPTEVLSLVGTALPGQPVLSLSPLIAGSAVLQTTSPATDLTNLLQLVQPQLQLQPQMLQVQHPSPLLRVATAGVDQDQTDCRPESSSLSSSHSIHNLWTSLGTGLSKPLDVVKEGAPEQQQETRGIAEVQNLTSLLDEINFLNQQTVTVATTVRVSSPVTQSKVNDHPHCSWIPQLESDSIDTVATEAQQIPGDQRTTTNSSKSSVLAPPPLLQMSVGGAKMAECSTGTGPAEGGGTEGGVAWRPMPRLVPLGLKGNQIS